MTIVLGRNWLRVPADVVVVVVEVVLVSSCATRTAWVAISTMPRKAVLPILRIILFIYCICCVCFVCNGNAFAITLSGCALAGNASRTWRHAWGFASNH